MVLGTYIVGVCSNATKANATRTRIVNKSQCNQLQSPTRNEKNIVIGDPYTILLLLLCGRDFFSRKSRRHDVGIPLQRKKDRLDDGAVSGFETDVAFGLSVLDR